MSKLKNMAVFSAMLVGVIMYASPAKSAVCFLPDDDGSCGGGDIEISDGSDSDDNKPEEKCEGFPVSATEYEKMKNCFDFTSCTKSKTKEVKYKKGAQKENTTWSNGICCTGGTTYDSAEGKCCPAGGCTHECDAPKKWSSTLRRCECPNGIETTTGICCNDGEHADGAICCPEKKHNEGGVCKCDSQYNTDKNGNCVLPNNCTYAYRKVTVSDSDGVTGDLDDGREKCTNSTTCWKNLQKITSLYIETGTPIVHPINKISNRSATCVDDKGETKYETICEGDPEYKCLKNDKKFIPNGCVSDAYHHGVIIKGDKWGTCGCDASKGYYDSIETCRTNANSDGCMKSNISGCYQTCKSNGYYSTKEECENTDYKVTCSKIDDCYKREMQGFLIKYDEDYKRKVSCSPSLSYWFNAEAFLADVNIINSKEAVGTYSKTIDGLTPSELPESKGYQYPAGTYYLCYRGDCDGTTTNACPSVALRSLQLLKQRYYSREFYYAMCFSSNPSSAGIWGNKECELPDDNSNNYICKKVEFTAGKTYKIRFDLLYGASCHLE